MLVMVTADEKTLGMDVCVCVCVLTRKAHNMKKLMKYTMAKLLPQLNSSPGS